MSDEFSSDRRPTLPSALALSLILAALYLPQTWYILMDYEWNDYRLGWLWLVPGLPTFWPVVLLPIPHVASLVVAMWFTTAGLGVGLFLASRRSARVFWIGLLLVLALSVFSAFFAHGAFRA